MIDYDYGYQASIHKYLCEATVTTWARVRDLCINLGRLRNHYSTMECAPECDLETQVIYYTY